MDPNTAMEAATEGAKALTRFQEIVQKIFGPRWTRKQADADAYADERKLKTIRDNPDMEIVYIAGEMHARERTPEMLAQRAEQRMLTEGIRQEENIENVLEIAAQELQQDDDVSDEAVDEDWITRLFNIVKDINNKEMQYVWGKILAGEIKTPGSFSLRTLETIRNLSQRDAQTFQKIIPLLFKFKNYIVILQKTEILEKYDINYHDLLVLDECGLIKMKSDTGINANINTAIEIHSQNRIVFFKGIENNSRKLTYRIYPLTSAGVELYSILSKEENVEYCIDFAKDVVKENAGIKMEASIHEIASIDKDNTIHYAIDPLMVIKTEGLK